MASNGSCDLALARPTIVLAATTSPVIEPRSASAEGTLDIEQTIDDGDRRVVVQWTVGSTFDGAPWQGIEPTSSNVTVRGVDVISLDPNGKIDQNTVYYDGTGFARQIGMLPREGSTSDRALLAAFNLTTKAKERLRNRRR